MSGIFQIHLSSHHKSLGGQPFLSQRQTQELLQCSYIFYGIPSGKCLSPIGQQVKHSSHLSWRQRSHTLTIRQRKIQYFTQSSIFKPISCQFLQLYVFSCIRTSVRSTCHQCQPYCTIRHSIHISCLICTTYSKQSNHCYYYQFYLFNQSSHIPYILIHIIHHPYQIHTDITLTIEGRI